MLEFLLVQRASGRLDVEATEGTGVIEVRRGQIASARAPGVPDLRARLARRDVVVPASTSELGIAAAVLDDGRLPRKQLADELHAAVQDAIETMVRWRRGQARFRSAPEDGHANPPELCIDPRWVLLDIARRLDESEDPPPRL
jgi:hypothetical protein